MTKDEQQLTDAIRIATIASASGEYSNAIDQLKNAFVSIDKNDPEIQATLESAYSELMRNYALSGDVLKAKEIAQTLPQDLPSVKQTLSLPSQITVGGIILDSSNIRSITMERNATMFPKGGGNSMIADLYLVIGKNGEALLDENTPIQDYEVNGLTVKGF